VEAAVAVTSIAMKLYRRASKTVVPTMVVVLLLTLFVSVFSAPVAQAEDYAIAQSYVHAFNNNVTVLTEVFALNKDFSLNTPSYVKYTVDFIQAGLFREDGEGKDAVSSASSSTAGGGNDTRNELTAGISHNFSDLVTVEIYYDYSNESDYTSSTPSINLTKELFNKNTTLTFGYSRNDDDISGRFMASARTRTTDNYYLGITQVVSPVTIFQVGYAHTESDGFQAEGIRLVPVDGVTQSSCTALSATCLGEVFPELRKRNAYILGINHYFAEGGDGMGGLFDRSSIKLSFRYYDDDWDIESYAGEVEYSKHLSDSNLLRLNYRFYTQSAAFFYKANVLSSDTLRTSSPQHRDFNTNLVGVKVSHNLLESLNVGPLVMGGIDGKYEFYAESTGTQAHVFMASLRFTY